MESKGIITVAVTVTVAVIVLAGILMPVLTDATKTEETFTNEGYYRMSYIDTDSDTYVMTYTKATNTLTVNGVEMDMSSVGNIGTSVMSLDTAVARYQDGLRLYVLGTGVSGSQGYSADTMEVTLSGGNMTAVSVQGGTTQTQVRTYTSGYVMDPAGDYVMKKTDKPAYLLKDTEYYGIGITNIQTTGTAVQSLITVSGTPESVTFGCVLGATTGVFSDESITASAVGGYVDLYSLDKLTATMTYDSTDTAITYSYFVVPYQVTAEKAVHLTDSQNALFMVIPVLVLVAILLGVAAVVLRSRME